jgi:hypothetical protein
MFKSLLCRVLILFCSLTIGMSSVVASNNFIPIQFPYGVTVDLPRNWYGISNNQLITLDAFVQSILEEKGRGSTGRLVYGANYYDDRRKTAGIFNIRFYSNLDITQSEASAVNYEDILELDAEIRKSLESSMDSLGTRLLAWLGTTKRSINDVTAFVTEYRRSSKVQAGSFHVRLVRVFNSHKSFTITISYREDQKFLLKPICDRIIGSLRL